MGIRIEDSVCVQEEHPLVLSTEAVKEVRETSRGQATPQFGVRLCLCHDVADCVLGRRYRSVEGVVSFALTGVLACITIEVSSALLAELRGGCRP